MLIKNITTLLLIALMFGCSAHRTSISEDGSESTIYEMEESAIFNIVYSSVQEVFPDEKISVLTAPVRGYITKFLAPPFKVDWFTQKVLVHRGTGENLAGQTVSGYWIEVSGSGSSFLQGQIKNDEVYKTILTHLNRSAKKHRVTNIQSQSYLLPQENFYVRGADTLEGHGARIIIKQSGNTSTRQTQAEQLRDLHQLHTDGILSIEEYKTAKKKVLSDY